MIEERIKQAISSAIVTVEGSLRVTQNAHFVFPGVNNDSLLFLLDQRGISVSAGSACQAGVLGPSHVLTGMGFSAADAASCLRVTLGYTTTEADAEAFIKGLIEAYPQALAASGSR
jgi:cysteine desulfurase